MYLSSVYLSSFVTFWYVWEKKKIFSEYILNFTVEELNIL